MTRSQESNRERQGQLDQAASITVLPRKLNHFVLTSMPDGATVGILKPPNNVEFNGC